MAEKKAGTGKKLGVFVVVAVVILAAGAFYKTDGFTKPILANPDAIEAPSSTHYYELDPLIINIASQGSTVRFLKVRPVIEIKNAVLYERMNKYEPIVRNALLSLYTQTPAVDMMGDNGFDNLRTQSLKTLRSTLQNKTSGDNISDVLFTEFVIQ